MGVPAGLKLNKQLNEFLGRFFLYHIYLWNGKRAKLRSLINNILYSNNLQLQSAYSKSYYLT